MSKQTAAHIFIAGQVQGVYFRAKTRETAVAHNVCGWVRNLPDGRVEAYFEGDVDAVDAMIDFCHEGSPAASVDSVEIERVEPAGFDEFEVRW